MSSSQREEEEDGQASSDEKPKAKQFVHNVNANDVLFGRGKQVNRNEGNIQFRKIVQGKWRDYVGDAKRHVARKIAQEVSDLGGRFLRKVDTLSNKEDSGTDVWEIVEEPVVTQKIKQAFRDLKVASRKGSKDQGKKYASASIAAARLPPKDVTLGTAKAMDGETETSLPSMSTLPTIDDATMRPGAAVADAMRLRSLMPSFMSQQLRAMEDFQRAQMQQHIPNNYQQRLANNMDQQRARMLDQQGRPGSELALLGPSQLLAQGVAGSSPLAIRHLENLHQLQQSAATHQRHQLMPSYQQQGSDSILYPGVGPPESFLTSNLLLQEQTEYERLHRQMQQQQQSHLLLQEQTEYERLHRQVQQQQQSQLERLMFHQQLQRAASQPGALRRIELSPGMEDLLATANMGQGDVNSLPVAADLADFVIPGANSNIDFNNVGLLGLQQQRERDMRPPPSADEASTEKADFGRRSL